MQSMHLTNLSLSFLIAILIWVLCYKVITIFPYIDVFSQINPTFAPQYDNAP